MIAQVHIENYKCLRDVSISLERFTVFVGANGSGKTSILQALDLLCRTFRVHPGQIDGEYRQNKTYGVEDEVELSCSIDEMHFRYRTKMIEGKAQLNGKHWHGEGNAFAKHGDPLDWKHWQQEHGMLPNPVWLRLDPNALRTTGPANSDSRMMLPNGQGLHSATAAMNLEDPDQWQKLQEDLRRIVPSIRRLRHTPQNELLFDMVNGKSLKAHQISEGTLLTLGLLSAIHGVNKPGLLLLDDLDRALHPKAQRELIELLRGVQATNPAIQIVATSHSPYLLGRMEPNEVQVTYLREDGFTVCEPLTHHPKFSKWKDELHPGEMWSMFGEKWVAEPEVVAK
jgi:predicted ATPase